MKKFNLLGLSVVTIGLLVGCAGKQVTPAEVEDNKFMLPNNYRNVVYQKVIQKLYLYTYQGFSVIYDNFEISKPDKKCSRNLFDDGITCVYRGKASIRFNIQELIKYGQTPLTKKYSYEVDEDGVYVY